MLSIKEKPMGDAFIYDAVRTPRGKGKDSGGLYTVKPLDLLVTALDGLQERNGFGRDVIDDVVVGDLLNGPRAVRSGAKNVPRPPTVA